MDLSVGEWELDFLVNILSSLQGFRWAISGPMGFLVLVNEGREDSNTTISGPSSVHQRNAILMADH